MATAGLDAFVVGGYFNVTPPAPVSGQRVPFQVDSAGNLLVTIAGGGGGGGVQYVDGVTQATPTGTVALGKNPSNILHALGLSALGNLNVNLAEGTISGGNAAASPTGAAVPASADYVGFNLAGNLVGVSSANPLPVAQQGTVTVTGTVTANQGGAPWSVDVTDRAARLLGVVYGSQAQQLKQTATNFNLQVELATGGTLYDARQIRALTSSDVVTVVQPTAASLNATVVFPSAQPVTLASTTITGTVAVTQSTSPWVENLSQVGGSNVTLGAKTSANSIPVVLATDEATLPVSIAGTVNVSVQNATLAVTQSTSPWVVSGTVTANQGTANATPWNENIAQFGGSAVVTGTGLSGAGIPRVTVSSDSFPATQPISGTVAINNFPATQPISAVSLPLPANAAQETGGNLATIASNTQGDPQVNDTLSEILVQIKLLNLNLATCIPSAQVDGDTILLDSIPTQR